MTINTDDLRALIESLRKSDGPSCFNEKETKEKIIEPLLAHLGWNLENNDEFYREYNLGGRRCDYCLRTEGQNKVFIEAKRVGEELGKNQEQLLDYAFREGVGLAILTNGLQWWFYLPLAGGRWQQRRFLQVTITEHLISKTIENLSNFLGRRNVETGKSVEIARAMMLNKPVTEEENVSNKRKSGSRGKPSATEMTGPKKVCYRFYSQLLERASKQGEHIHAHCSPTTDQFLGAGPMELRFNYFLQGGQKNGVVGLYLDSRKDKRINKGRFDALMKERARIESDFGGPLQWLRKDDQDHSAIVFEAKSGGVHDDESKWPVIQDEMINAMARLYKALKPRLSSL